MILYNKFECETEYELYIDINDHNLMVIKHIMIYHIKYIKNKCKLKIKFEGFDIEYDAISPSNKYIKHFVSYGYVMEISDDDYNRDIYKISNTVFL
jgi:hypothetical protein